MYEWALETMQYLSAMNLDRTRSPSEVEVALDQLQHFVNAHPSPLTVETEHNMNDTLARINNSELDAMWRTARQRCVHSLYRGWG